MGFHISIAIQDLSVLDAACMNHAVALKPVVQLNLTWMQLIRTVLHVYTIDVPGYCTMAYLGNLVLVLLVHRQKVALPGERRPRRQLLLVF